MQNIIKFNLKRIIYVIISILFCIFLFYISVSTTILPELIPLNSEAIKSTFYLSSRAANDPTDASENLSKIGYGYIDSAFFSDSTNSISDYIISQPDVSSFVPSNMVISWTDVYYRRGQYRVIGVLEENNSFQQTTCQSVEKSIHNVKDFGAKGDGITDDSDAIIKAINNSGTIYFPDGTYKITKQIVIPNGCTLQGSSNTVLDFFDNITTGYDYGYIVNENSDWMVSSNTAHDIGIKNITIKKSNVSETAKSIILLTNVSDVLIDNISVITTKDDPANTVNMLVNCNNIQVTNSSFYQNNNSQTGGFWIQDRCYDGVYYGTSNIKLSGCSFYKTGGVDEQLAIFTVPDKNGIYASVSDVSIDKCNFYCNSSNNSTDANFNALYTVNVSLGDTKQIRFSNTNFENNNLLVGMMKFLYHSGSIEPVIFDSCSFNSPESYFSPSGYIFYSERINDDSLAAQINNCSIYASNNVVVANKNFNFSYSDFFISNNAVALESNNIAKNCVFKFSNCSEKSRVIRNNKSTIIDSRLIFCDSTAPSYTIQPLILENVLVESDVTVLIQKYANDASYSFSNVSSSSELKIK